MEKQREAGLVPEEEIEKMGMAETTDSEMEQAMEVARMAEMMDQAMVLY